MSQFCIGYFTGVLVMAVVAVVYVLLRALWR